MSIEANQLRAEHYQARAIEAAGFAKASSLTQVREKHELAADTWARLAEFEQRIAASAIARLSRAEADRNAHSSFDL